MLRIAYDMLKVLLVTASLYIKKTWDGIYTQTLLVEFRLVYDYLFQGKKGYCCLRSCVIELVNGNI